MTAIMTGHCRNGYLNEVPYYAYTNNVIWLETNIFNFFGLVWLEKLELFTVKTNTFSATLKTSNENSLQTNQNLKS